MRATSATRRWREEEIARVVSGVPEGRRGRLYARNLGLVDQVLVRFPFLTGEALPFAALQGAEEVFYIKAAPAWGHPPARCRR